MFDIKTKRINLMGFEDTKPKTKEEELKDLLDYLEETRFNFACFVDSFKRYLVKAGIITKDD
jgi:hypothetical protein